MKSSFFGVIASFLFVFIFTACAAKQNYGYEIQPLSVGSQGSALFKVFSYGRTQDKAIEQAKHDAVHGVLFKGIVGGGGTAPQPALVKPNELAEHDAFFKEFFKSKEYLRFVNLSSDGSVSHKDRLKVGKMYKVGVVVSVQKDALRKYLEQNGVIRSLGSLF